MFSKKKGSLELSVNAIVILILAITILGLGIGFIKSMFDKTTRQIIDINKDIASKMTQDLKESTERIKLDQDNLEIEQGKTKEIYLALRNELDNDYTYTIDGGGSIDIQSNPGKWNGDNSVITCYTAFDSTGILTGKNSNTNPIYFSAVKSVFIKKGEINVGKFVANIKGKAREGTYSCSVIIKDPSGGTEEYARADFQISVTE
jgi:hypothetical protein